MTKQILYWVSRFCVSPLRGFPLGMGFQPKTLGIAAGGSSSLYGPCGDMPLEKKKMIFFPSRRVIDRLKTHFKHLIQVQILTSLSNVSDAVSSFMCQKVFFFVLKFRLVLHDQFSLIKLLTFNSWLLIALVCTFHVHHF